MNDCPEIDALLQGDAKGRNEISAHVAGCEGCAAVLALEELRGSPDGADATEQPEGCAAALVAIAASAEGRLDDEGRRRLSAHVAGCARCRETSVRMAALFASDLDDVPEPVWSGPRVAGAGVVVAMTPEMAARRRVSTTGKQKAKLAVGVGLVVAGVAGVAAAAAVAVVRWRTAAGPSSDADPPVGTEPAVNARASRAREAASAEAPARPGAKGTGGRSGGKGSGDR